MLDFTWVISYSIYLSLSDISLGIILSKSIHVAENGKILFLFKADNPPCMCVCVCVCYFHSSVGGNSDCIHTLAIINKCCYEHCIHVSFFISVFIFSRYRRRSGTAGSYGGTSLNFWEESIIFSIVAVQIYISSGSAGGFPFLHIFSNICYFFHNSHSDR